MKYEYKVAWCPFCDQGWVEIVKSTVSGKLLLLCSECDTIWAKPEDIALDLQPIVDLSGLVEVPTFEEIQASGWDVNILK